MTQVQKHEHVETYNEETETNFRAFAFFWLVILSLVTIFWIAANVEIMSTIKKNLNETQENLTEMQDWIRENSEVVFELPERERTSFIEMINCFVDTRTLELRECENKYGQLIKVSSLSFAFPDTISGYKTNAVLLIENIVLRVGYTFSDINTFNGELLRDSDIIDFDSFKNKVTIKKSIEKNMDMYPSYLSEHYRNYPYNQSKQGFRIDIHGVVLYDMPKNSYYVLKGTNISTERFFR